jgi:hypothetical protein
MDQGLRRLNSFVAPKALATNPPVDDEDDARFLGRETRGNEQREGLCLMGLFGVSVSGRVSHPKSGATRHAKQGSSLQQPTGRHALGDCEQRPERKHQFAHAHCI